jgi:beta-N-acetylhexosaminidase
MPRPVLNNPAGSLWILGILVSACSGVSAGPAQPAIAPEDQPADATSATPTESMSGPARAQAARTVEPALAWPERVFGEMTLREKIAQMIMPFVLGNFAPEGTETHDRIVEVIEKENVGGVIMSVGAPTDVAVKLNDLQRHSKYPLLVGADLETGAGFRFWGAVHVPTNIALGGATIFPSLMAFGATGDPTYAYKMGRVTALEARAMGVHLPFAPVLDVNNNPDNPIINIRSFGEDPNAVAAMGVSFVRGLQDNGVLATGKHFPGHGDTEVDSHLALPIIRVERERMDSVELVPFRAAIDAGMRGIMSAHIAVPALGGGFLPSTLAGQVLDDLLRTDMGFDGIIFTDAMDMSAVNRMYPRGEASVMAVLAGADVILMPPDVTQAIDAILRAVGDGRIAESRIDRSVMKLLRLKEEMGLDEEREVPLEAIPQVVGIPEHTDIAQEVAERSITLLRNQRDLLPLLGTRTARVMSVTFRSRTDVLASRYFDARLRETYPRLVTTRVDDETNGEVYQDLRRRARSSNLVVVSVYSNFAGRVEMPDETVEFINLLARERITHVVISFGNPYLISEFPDAQAYLVAWSSAPVSQRAAAEALLGGIEVAGRAPAGMPPFFELGDGIHLPLKVTASGR